MRLRSLLSIFCLLCTGIQPFSPVRAAAPLQTSANKTPEMLQFQSGGHTLGFLPDQAYLAGLDHALRVEFIGTPGVSPQSAGAEAAAFSRVTYPDLWPGINLDYTAAAGGITESTYTLAPGADPAFIQLRYNTPVSQQADGSLRFTFTSGYLEEAAPVAWQEVKGQRVAVEVSFRLEMASSQVGFLVGSYDPRYPLLIDPAYTWHTFYGGSSLDNGNAIAVDGSGSIYVAGQSNASWTGPAGQAPLHAFSEGANLVVVKLSSSGAYQWHTFYGGSSGFAIAIDGSGNIYLAGYSGVTWSGPDGQAPLHVYSGNINLVVIKLNSSGAYQWHTFYLCSSGYDEGNAIALDSSGGVYVAGLSRDSWNGPAGQAPLHVHSGGDDFLVVKLNSSGGYLWHTFYGGSGNDGGFAIATDNSGNIYVTGLSRSTWTGPDGQAPLHARSSGDYELVVIKLNSSGVYQWHTFYGGGGDGGFAIAVDSSGGVYVTGYSPFTWTGPEGQAPLHVHSGISDLVAIKLNSSGAYQWHTFYGSGSNGSCVDYGEDIAVDERGNVYVTGYSFVAGWAGLDGQAPLHAFSGTKDLVLIKLNSSGGYLWHTFYGSTEKGNAIALDDSGGVYVAGNSNSNWVGPDSQAPLHAHSGYYDLVVLKMTSNPLEITMLGNGAEITAGDTTPTSADDTDFGNVVLDETLTRTFTIRNDGNLDLTVSSISLAGADDGDFSISGITLPKTVGPKQTTTFQVSFTPPAAGTRTATVSIASNDPDKSPYDFAIRGTGITPANLSVQGNNTDITSGDTTPSSSDHTDFGNVVLDETFTRTFTIRNSGDLDLTISSIRLDGADAGDFSLSGIVTTTTVHPAATVDFQMSFTPSTAGTQTATVSIANDDPDKGLYDFAIQGMGITPANLSVQGNGVTIANGDTTPTAADDTDFGNVVLDETLTHTFTIRNNGDLDLTISSIRLDGADAGDFSLSGIVTTTTVHPAATVDFQVSFTPSAAGAQTATVSIASNDPENGSYDFAIQGMGITPANLSVQGNGVTIVEGDTTPASADDTDFGNVVLDETLTRTFTIKNNGDLDLTISSIRLDGAAAGDFSISGIVLPATVNPGQTITFQVSFTPSTAGTQTATVSITSDDPAKSPYDFAIQGTGKTQSANRIYLPIISS